MIAFVYLSMNLISISSLPVWASSSLHPTPDCPRWQPQKDWAESKMQQEEVHKSIRCVWIHYNVNVIIPITIKIRLFQKYKVCLVIAFVACSCSGRHPVCLGWTVSHPETVCAVWMLPVSEGQTLKCQHFLRLQVWLIVIRRTTWEKTEGAGALIERVKETIHVSFGHLFSPTCLSWPK